MSINNDDLMLESSCYFEKLDFLINSLGDDLKKELRGVIINEVSRSNSYISLMLEKIIIEFSKVSNPSEKLAWHQNKKNQLYDLVKFDSPPYIDRKCLISELKRLENENVILNSELKNIKGDDIVETIKKISSIGVNDASENLSIEKDLGLDFSLPEDVPKH